MVAKRAGRAQTACVFVGVELQQEGTGIIQGALVHWGTGALSVFTCFFVIPSWESLPFGLLVKHSKTRL